MNIPYENLDLIPQLLNKVEDMQIQLSKLTNKEKKIDLTKLINVSQYLNVSKTTIGNYIKDGRFKENVHYKKYLSKKMVKYIFVESAIIKFKESLQ